VTDKTAKPYKWPGIEKLAHEIVYAYNAAQPMDELLAVLSETIEPLLEAVDFACTLNFTDHDRELLRKELDTWRKR